MKPTDRSNDCPLCVFTPTVKVVKPDYQRNLQRRI